MGRYMPRSPFTLNPSAYWRGLSVLRIACLNGEAVSQLGG